MRPPQNPFVGVGAKKAQNGACMSLFGASLFSEKSFSWFGDCLRRICRGCMSLFGASLFSEKSFLHFGDCLRRICRGCMSFFGAFFFSDKMDRRFSGMPMRCDKAYPFIHCPNQTPTRHRCSHWGHQNFPMMHDTCPLQNLCHSFSAIGRCCAPH